MFEIYRLFDGVRIAGPFRREDVARDWLVVLNQKWGDGYGCRAI